jgi:hypothetical protein
MRLGASDWAPNLARKVYVAGTYSHNKALPFVTSDSYIYPIH